MSRFLFTMPIRSFHVANVVKETDRILCWKSRLKFCAFPLAFLCTPWREHRVILSKRSSGKKKAHKHKLFCPVGLGTTPDLSGDFTGFVPGTNPVKTLSYTVEARFHRACPWDKPGLSQGQSRGRRAAQKVYVKRVYVPFSLARSHLCHLGACKVLL